MKLTILGCYAATPRTFSNPTAQILEINNAVFLIDCAEGTQVQLRKSKVKFTKISKVFISHLHGDHFYGLIGLISTFTLLNRENDLHIYGPKGIKEIILLQLKYANSYTSYGLYFHELESTNSQIIYEDIKVKVTTIPLQHRVYTNGYLFEEKNNDHKLNFEGIEKYKIDQVYFNKIKSGGSVTLENGEIISNSELSFPPKPNKKYAFCSDTKYNENIIPLIQNADYLYHESTFLESELHLAERTMHSTAKQAAQIAKLANVKQLILGHFSTRYSNTSQFEDEAKIIFPETQLAEDGKVFDLI